MNNIANILVNIIVTQKEISILDLLELAQGLSKLKN